MLAEHALAAMPWGDWQFWVVTLAAVLCGVLVVRSLWPKQTKRKSVELTIDRERQRSIRS